MKKLRIFFITGYLLGCNVVLSQSEFNTGTGVTSIEPEESLISLHLGGYGAPRDGRFTLEWKSKCNISSPSSLCGADGKLFVISSGKLLSWNPDEDNCVWTTEGSAGEIISLAGSGTELYGLNRSGDILTSKTSRPAKWKKFTSTSFGAERIAVSGSTIFLSCGDGSLMKSYQADNGIKWENTGSVPGIACITAGDGNLYALTSEGVIFKTTPSRKDHKWLRIAYRNNETIKEEIRYITILNNRLWGISSDNNLLLGDHRSEGNLSARAMVIRSGEKRAAIINVDVCGLTDNFTGELKREIRQKYHLSPSEVFINCSHTHFAPVTQEWLTWQEANQLPDSIYLNSTVKNGILDALDKALRSMSPSTIWFGRGKTDIGYNRSLKDHPELYDSDVDVIKISYENDQPENYLFMAACHPVFSTAGSLHYTLSANYPGVARKLIEERTGSTNALFLQGTAGDINPRDNGEYISGEKLANEVISVLTKPMTKVEGDISSYLDTINIPIKQWSREEIIAFRKENENKTGDVYAEKNVRWCDLMMEYYRNGTMPSSLPVYVQTINIGNWKLVGFSRETTTGYSFGVKHAWPGKLVSVAGYTNDVSSYLPTDMHLEAKNYEGLDSFFWYGMPNVFPMKTDEVILKRIITLAR